MNISYNHGFDFSSKSTKEFAWSINQLIKNGEEDIAIELLEIGILYYHQTSRMCYLFGKAYGKKDKAKAVEYLNRSLSTKPNFRPALLELSKHDPSVYTSLIRVAHLLRKSMKFDISKDFYNKAMSVQLKNNMPTCAYFIKSHLELNGLKTFFEIGTFVGYNVLQIEAQKSFAIDKELRIPSWENNIDPTVSFYNMTSNLFFKDHNSEIATCGIDACLIDGARDYENQLKDVQNCLKYVNDNFLMVIPNCLPSNTAAALASLQEAQQHASFTGEWFGEAYKTLLWLSVNYQDLEITIIKENGGTALIQKGINNIPCTLSENEIKSFNFNELAFNRYFRPLTMVEYLTKKS